MGLYKLPKIIGKNKKPLFGARINPCHSMSQGLVGAWLCNEGAGSISFDSNKLHNASLTNTVWMNDNISMNGSSSKISIQNTPDLALTGNWTYAIIINFRNVPDVTPIIVHYDGGGSGRNIYMYNFGGKVYIDIPNVAAILISNYVFSLNTEYLIVASKEGTNWSLYVNGALDKTVSKVNSQEVATTSLDVGCSTTANTYFNGYIKQYAIWDRTLTEREIASIYVDPYQMFLPVVWDAYFVPTAAPPPTGGKSIFGYDSIFHAGGIIQT